MIHFRKGRERERERERWMDTGRLSHFFRKTKNVFLSSLLCPDFQKSVIDPPREREREREREKEKEKESGTKSSSLRLIVFLKESVQ